MKKWVLKSVQVLLLVLAGLSVAVQARAYNQGELDSLLAPVALYPDPLLTHVLNAAAFPQDVVTAAEWRRQNSQLSADDAMRAVEGQPWHPSVKALLAQPDVLQRMTESPQWLAQLGEAFLNQPQEVHATVQQLRMRAQDTGSLKSDENQYVYQQGQTIVVQPAWPNVVYAPYYNPYVAYGGWWWPAYRPVFWRPWAPYAVRVTHFVPAVPLRPWPLAHTWSGRTWAAQPRQPVMRQPMPQPSQLRTPLRSSTAPQFNQPRPQTARLMPPPTMQATPYRAIPESHRAPIVQSHGYFRGGSSFGRGSSAGGGGRRRS